MTEVTVNAPVSEQNLVVTPDQLGAQADTTLQIPKAVIEIAQAWVDDYKVHLAERTKAFIKRQSKALAEQRRHPGPTEEAGEITVGPNVAFDIVTTSPIQLITGGNLPPYPPSKIIAHNEWAFLVSLTFINPIWPLPPANVQLGGRTLNTRFSQFNLTTGVAAFLPTLFPAIVLPAPAPALVLNLGLIPPGPPPANPNVIEVNVTADIAGFAQPYAAFATWHLDVDADPGFFLPPVPPQFQHEVPMRYMVYPK